MNYLVLRRLKVVNANAQPAPWLIAPPSPTAYVGFTHKLGRELGVPFSGVQIIHHDIEYRAERINGRKYAHQFRGATLINKQDYAGSSVALSSQPSARCNITVSLMLELPEGFSVAIGDVLNHLHRLRLAGGVIQDWARDPETCDEEKLAMCIPNGFVVTERTDLLRGDGHGEDVLHKFLNHTARDRHQQHPWLMPALLGYRAVTPLQERARVRENYPHAFAEPLIGLVQLVPISNAPAAWWRYQADHPNYLVSTQ